MRVIKKDHWLRLMPIAHRGYHDKHRPENSLGAFKEAVKKDYAIELDLHITCDNKIIVFHDEDTKRMTGVDFRINEVSYEELKELKLLETSEKIPLLSEVLKLVDGKVPLMIEIKNTSKVGVLEKKLIEELENYEGEYVIQAFNPFRIKWLNDNAPHVVRGQLSGTFKGYGKGIISKILLRNMIFNFITKPDYINYEISGLSNIVPRLMRSRGVPVLSWTARCYGEYFMALKKSDNVVFEKFTI